LILLLKQDIYIVLIVSRLVQFLKSPNNIKLQIESSWTLSNIASGSLENIEAIVKAGTVPILTELLLSKNRKNYFSMTIISNEKESRNIILNQNVIPKIKNIFNLNPKLEIVRSLAKLISVLCSGEIFSEFPDFSLVKFFLPILTDLINNQTDEEVLIYTCEAFGYLSDGPNEKIEVLV
jgi:hypothetical protein